MVGDGAWTVTAAVGQVARAARGVDGAAVGVVAGVGAVVEAVEEEAVVGGT